MCLRRAAGAVFAVGILLLGAAGSAGAVTWRPVQTGSTDPITAIDYRSPTQLWFTTSTGKLFARNPDGTFAQQATFPGRQFFDISFRPSADIGLAAADSGQLFRFAGGTWAPVSLANATFDHGCPMTSQPPYARATPTENLTAVAWSSDSVAWAVGDATGMVLKSTDAGATWTDVSRLADGTCRLPDHVEDVGPIPGSQNDVYFVALVRPAATLWRTTDGLASPALRPSQTTSCGDGILRIAVDPASPNRVGWIEPCVEFAPILFQWSFTGDAGTSHDYVDTPPLAPLRDVAAAPGAFLAVGDGGTIRRTFDGRVSASIRAGGPLAGENWLAVDYADRAHAAVGGAGGVLALSDDVDPRPTLVVGHGASARGAGRRVRVRVGGRLKVPAGIPAATACQGKVFLTVKRGRRTLASRNATVRPSCRFSKTVTLPRRRVGGARRLTVVVRFGGNAQLGVRTKTLRVRVRR